jgi:hypothetical protein
LTVILRETPPEVPPEFEAVTLNVCVEAIVLAVPEITPVAELKLNPLGKVVGEMA